MSFARRAFVRSAPHMTLEPSGRDYWFLIFESDWRAPMGERS
jgi:hypothetical protein